MTSFRRLVALGLTLVMSTAAFGEVCETYHIDKGSRSAALAAEPCRSLLDDADRDYARGRLEQARAAVCHCLIKEGDDSEATWLEERVALEILAKTLVGLDERGKAGEAATELLRTYPDFEPELRDPYGFKTLVEERRQELGAFQTTTVSGTAENLREAPATVVVVDAEQIRRRGYVDLEQLLHDLPGFDISRGNGIAYSNIYQRGFRSNTTDRTLLLVDGVEQNDIHSNTAYLSRQYPLSNVERVEVVYGPSSTIYGPNAYTGVINVITRAPEAYMAKDEKFGGRVDVAGGSLDTRLVDVTMGGRNTRSRLSWQLTGRVFTSSEEDLSARPSWDFSPTLFDEVRSRDYVFLLRERPEDFDPAQCGDLCALNPETQMIEPTPAGLARAVAIDKLSLAQSLNGRPIGFSDDTDDIYFLGKLNISDLTVGFQYWRREEGTSPWYPDALRAGADNGSLWIPRQGYVYGRYSRQVSRSVRLNISGRYLQHDLGEGSGFTSFRGYANGALDLADLLASRSSFWRRTEVDQLSTQMRSEMSAVYSPTRKFRLISGFEVRNSSIQGAFATRVIEESLTGAVEQNATAREKFNFRDIGVYAQGTYKFTDLGLSLIGGVRVDDNDLRDDQPIDVAPGTVVSDTIFVRPTDSGTNLSPRLAVVYAPSSRTPVSKDEKRSKLLEKATGGGLTLKLIYSEAFLNPSSLERFSVDDQRPVRNPSLGSEEVRNIELSAGWSNQDGSRFLEVVFYDADYGNRVALGAVRDHTPELNLPDDDRFIQFASLGKLKIRGAQAQGAWSLVKSNVDLFGNLTYTDPQTLTNLRVADIADWQANFGVNASWLEGSKRGPFNLNLRVNHVGEREIGRGTTVQFFDKNQDLLDSYTVLAATLSYRLPLGKALGDTSFQVIVNNLLDEVYFHPGVQAAGNGFVERIPQNGRTVLLRISTTTSYGRD